MKKLLLVLLVISSQLLFSQYVPSAEENAFLDTLQYRSFLYFMNEINPENGLVKDRTTEDSPATIAASGWAVAAWGIGVEHGWISRDKAAELTLTLERFLINSDQSTKPDATGYKGFYYHFLKMDSGKREWNCELSTVDTAWLIAGIRFAVQYYNGDNEIEKEIRDLGEKLTNRVDWNWAVVKESRHDNHTGLVSMGYDPERGLNDYGYFGYTEALYLYILAAGTNLNEPMKTYDVWLSGYNWKEPYEGFPHVIFPPLFGHQYTQMFIDLRDLPDKYMREKGIDYFENSRRATLVNRLYCIQNPEGWEGYDSLTWGISACDGPGDFEKNGKRFHGYAGRGASGPGLTIAEDGTITPEAAAGSIPFAPEVCIPTLKNMYDKYGEKGLWGKYGLKDAFNLTVDWYDKDYLGLDEGPIVIMIENYRTGLIWNYAMKDSVIQRGLERLGFGSGE